MDEFEFSHLISRRRAAACLRTLKCEDDRLEPATARLLPEIFVDLIARLARPLEVRRGLLEHEITVLDAFRYRIERRERLLEGLTAQAGGDWSPEPALGLIAPLGRVGWIGDYIERHWREAILRTAPASAGEPGAMPNAAGYVFWSKLCLQFELGTAVRRALRREREFNRAFRRALRLDEELLAMALRSAGFGWGNPVSVADYTQVWRHWSAYRRLAQDAPNLTWLYHLALAERVPFVTREPLRALKLALRRYGVLDAGWKLLLSSNRREFAVALEAAAGSRFEAVAHWLALHQRLQLARLVPQELAEALVRQHVREEDDCVEFREGWFLLPDGLARLAALECLGLARRAARRRFIDEEFHLVFLWEEEVRPSPAAVRQGARWAHFLARARRWSARVASEKALDLAPWDAPLEGAALGEYEAVALNDAGALWDEGLALRHCVGTYAPRCARGPVRVYSLRHAADGTRVATVCVRRGPQGWRLTEARGFANAGVSEAVRRAAEELVNLCNEHGRVIDDPRWTDPPCEPPELLLELFREFNAAPGAANDPMGAPDRRAA